MKPRAVLLVQWAVIDFEGFALRRMYGLPALRWELLCSDVSCCRLRSREAMLEIVGLSVELQGLVSTCGSESSTRVLWCESKGGGECRVEARSSLVVLTGVVRCECGGRWATLRCWQLAGSSDKSCS